MSGAACDRWSYWGVVLIIVGLIVNAAVNWSGLIIIAIGTALIITAHAVHHRTARERRGK